MSTVFAGVLRHQNCLYIVVQKLWERWFPGKFWIWALVAAFSSVWDVYWCNHIQALTFRTGSQTPSLDSKMCQFPRISLSELRKARSFRLILHQGLLASPFCVGFLSKTFSKWSFWAGCWIPLWWQFLSKTSLESFVQAKIWFFKPKSAVGKWSSKEMWMEQHRKITFDTF